jgi:hypothetical protein
MRGSRLDGQSQNVDIRSGRRKMLPSHPKKLIKTPCYEDSRTGEKNRRLLHDELRVVDYGKSKGKAQGYRLLRMRKASSWGLEISRICVLLYCAGSMNLDLGRI